MKCTVCDNNNPQEAVYCGACGQPLGTKGDLLTQNHSSTEPDPLRPLEFSSFLVESARIYRNNFVYFIAISLIPQLPGILMSFGNIQDLRIILPILLLFSPLYVLSSAASVMGISQYYLAGQIDIGYCFRRAWYKILSLYIAFLVFGLVLIGAGFLTIILIGLPLLLYLFTVWFFFVECIMLDRKGPLDSLWQSRDLVSGSFWRIFGIGLGFTAIIILASVFAQILVSTLIPNSHFLAIIFLSVVSIVILPIGWIGRTLVYYDLRLRKEAYTIDDLTDAFYS